MKLKEQARTIRRLRNQIPSSSCITGCTKCCGLVPMTLWEFKQMGGKAVDIDHNANCPFLDGDKCGNYSERPIICRVFGMIKKEEKLKATLIAHLICKKDFPLTGGIYWKTAVNILDQWIDCKPQLWVSPKMMAELESKKVNLAVGHRTINAVRVSPFYHKANR